MYHAIVRSRVRALWREVGTGNYQVAVEMATPDLKFQFLGNTPISDRFIGADNFAKWFVRLYEIFPGLTMRLTDVAVAGPPWRTTAVVRLAITATLRDGSQYSNEAMQWAVLKWGRLVEDYILEDTEALARACAVQSSAA